MYKQEHIALTCFGIVLIFVLWLLNGWLVEACMRSKFVNFVQQFVMLVLRNVRNSKTLTVSNALIFAVSAQMNAVEWLLNSQNKRAVKSFFLFLHMIV